MCITIVEVEKQLVLLVQGLCLYYYRSYPRANHIFNEPYYMVIHTSVSTIFLQIVSLRARFLKKKILNIKCVLISSTSLSVKFLNLRRIRRDITINLNGYSCQVHIILSDVNKICIF